MGTPVPNSTSLAAADPRRLPICQPGGRGVVFPLGGDAELEWSYSVRGLLYGIGLLYCFLGVSIVADIFMNSIETITSKKKRIRVKNTDRFVTVRLWNDTVANLTLMALGSSAPEILLSVIDLLTRNCFSSELGPSTIVGSAAFNLLVIIAVCIVAIPDGEVRIVKEVPVFFVTALFSLFSYFWLLFIVQFNSTHVVDIWEGLVTFAFFPILVIVSYLADSGVFSCKNPEEEPAFEHLVSASKPGQGSGDQVPLGGNDLEDQSEPLSVSRAQRRSDAIRSLLGGRRTPVDLPVGVSHVELEESDPVSPFNQPPDTESDVIVEFPCSLIQAIISETETITVSVIRSGNLAGHIQVSYKTLNGSLTSERGYQQNSGTLAFAPGEAERRFEVRLESMKQTGDFSVLLANPSIQAAHNAQALTKINSGRIAKINSGRIAALPRTVGLGRRVLRVLAVANDVILDARGDEVGGEQGCLCFGTDMISVAGGQQSRVLRVPVFRRNGVLGCVSCCYRTEKLTAVPGYDFVECEGELVFEEEEQVQEVSITVLPKRLGERADQFQLVIEEPTAGAAFDPSCDGGVDRNVLTVTIQNERHSETTGFRLRMMTFLDSLINFDEARLGTANWGEQVVESFFCNGSREEQNTASVGDWMMHITVLPWKVLYAVSCPPPIYFGGWLCFLCALIHIGILSAIIRDLAELFGCVLKIQDSVTAITFVALGTSLPDLFASKSAATQDEYADASIVNVTGSNSVNVCLGIGLPWSIGAIYWHLIGASDDWVATYPEEALRQNSFFPGEGRAVFVVSSKNLSFGVIVFSISAMVCLSLLRGRRVAFGGELGGPKGSKIVCASFLVLLWVCWLALCIWNAEATRSASEQTAAVLLMLAFVIGTIICSGLAMTLFQAWTDDGPRGKRASLLGLTLGAKDTAESHAGSEGDLGARGSGSPLAAGGQPLDFVEGGAPNDASKMLNVIASMRREQARVQAIVERWVSSIRDLEATVRLRAIRNSPKEKDARVGHHDTGSSANEGLFLQVAPEEPGAEPDAGDADEPDAQPSVANPGTDTDAWHPMNLGRSDSKLGASTDAASSMDHAEPVELRKENSLLKGQLSQMSDYVATLEKQLLEKRAASSASRKSNKEKRSVRISPECLPVSTGEGVVVVRSSAAEGSVETPPFSVSFATAMSPSCTKVEGGNDSGNSNTCACMCTQRVQEPLPMLRSEADPGEADKRAALMESAIYPTSASSPVPPASDSDGILEF